MEAVPRLPMISFELKTSPEPVSFGPKLKQYITSFFNEDAESYNGEISTLESLRAAASRPTIDIVGIQTLKKYYCQLQFLKSRFPMEENQPCAVYFSWRDHYSKVVGTELDIDFELMNVLYNIGAMHSKLGAEDPRTTPDGMKLACTHFQCGAWAFQTIPQIYSLVVTTAELEIIQFMQLACLAQAQECIVEKSMMDNRKAAIIAKLAVQVVDYYKQALWSLQNKTHQFSLTEILGLTYKDWINYINFKISYHKTISLLYQGQQAEEQQKMGERVAFYQAASDQLQESCQKTTNLNNQQEIKEALSFTGDVVEGKKKAAKNENEFIYHEEVPEREVLQEVRGASLVKGIPFNINDHEVSGQDIFARLVPMEAHEASSLYSEKKAQMLRQIGEMVENKDRAMVEFMSSMKLDVLNQMQQASGYNQDLIDRAAAMSAKPTAVQDLVDAMSKLSGTYHDVESMLSEIDEILKAEIKKEESYQAEMGSRPPSILATDLTREFHKYQEAHSKASDSNEHLHRAMMAHVANLKILALPLPQLMQQIPAVQQPNNEINEEIIGEIKNLKSKVDEMKNQRIMLWNQLRDSVKNDDITSLLVTRQPNVSVDELFKQELQKHQKQAAVLEQNMAAQDNIFKAFIETYAKFTPTRRYLQDVISKRSTTLSSLINSYDTYDDLLSKANKGIEFYNKLETNVSKLLQRIKSTAKVQDEEREQMLAKHSAKHQPKLTNPITTTAITGSTTPKLKDYLESRKQENKQVVDSSALPQSYTPAASGIVPSNLPEQNWPPGVRPAPLGSEMTTDNVPMTYSNEQYVSNYQGQLYYNPVHVTAGVNPESTTTTYSSNYNYSYTYADKSEEDLNKRMATLMSSKDTQYYQQPQQSAVVAAPEQNYAYPTNGYPSQLQQNTMYYPTYTSLPQEHIDSRAYSSTENNSEVANSSMKNNYSTNEYSPNNYTYYHSADLKTSTRTSSMYSPISSIYSGENAAKAPNTNTSNEVSYNNYASNNFQNYQTPYVSDAYGQTSAVSSGTYPIGVQQNVISTNINPVYNTQETPYSNTLQYPQNTDPQSALSQNNTFSNIQNVTPAQVYYQQYNTNMASQLSATQPVDGNYGALSYNTSNQNLASQTNYQQYTTDTSYQSYVPQQVTSNLNTDVYNNQNQQYIQNYTPVEVNPNAYYNYQPTTVDYSKATVMPGVSSVNTSSYVNQQLAPTTSVYAEVTQPVKKEKSNIDLLSGLDFSINQAPLIPQTKTETKPESPIVTQAPPVIPASNQSSKQDEKVTETLKQTLPIVELKRKEIHFDTYSLRKSDNAKQFLQELEKYEKFVDLLTTKTLNGPTTLDIKWKEIQDQQDSDQHKCSISVARCYPMKNRYPDILPYDQTRMRLSSTKDDYINASLIKDVTSNAPTFIVTQAPLQSTFNDFYTLIWEQGIEVVLCLIGDNDLEQDKYWPTTPDQSLTIGDFWINLQVANVRENWTESIIRINHTLKRSSRVVKHLQFTAWPGSLFPPTISVSSYINEVVKSEKLLEAPLLVHCLAGIGRSGMFSLLIAAVVEVLVNPKQLPDLQSIAIKMNNARKNILRDREHLKFAYNSFLCFLKDMRASQIQTTQPKDNAGPSTSNTEVQVQQNVTSTSIVDPLNLLDPLWATKRNSTS